MNGATGPSYGCRGNPTSKHWSPFRGDCRSIPSLVPLQLIDDFLLPYSLDQAVLLLFLLVIVAVFPLQSRKGLSLNLLLFGVLFMGLPQSTAAFHFTFLGIALVVILPLLYIT